MIKIGRLGESMKKDGTESILEQERQKLHSLIQKEASKEEIQKQSEVLDKEVANYYSSLK